MVKFPPFWGFGPQNHSFRPKTGPWGDPPKTLHKHNVLGAFLEAPGRKNWFWAQKGGISPKIIFFAQKEVFKVKSWNFAETWKTFQNVTFFALKT